MTAQHQSPPKPAIPGHRFALTGHPVATPDKSDLHLTSATLTLANDERQRQGERIKCMSEIIENQAVCDE